MSYVESDPPPPHKYGALGTFHVQKKMIPAGCGVFGFQLAFPSLLWLDHLPLFDCGDRGEAAMASSAVIICGRRQTGDTVSLPA